MTGAWGRWKFRYFQTFFRIGTTQGIRQIDSAAQHFFGQEHEDVGLLGRLDLFFDPFETSSRKARRL